MCDDLSQTVAELQARGVEMRGDPADESFGVTTRIVLPGGVEVLLYQPKHNSPLSL